MGQSTSRPSTGTPPSRPATSLQLQNNETPAPDPQQPSRRSFRVREYHFGNLRSPTTTMVEPDPSTSAPALNLRASSRLNRARSTISSSIPHFLSRNTSTRTRNEPDRSARRRSSFMPSNPLRRSRPPSRHVRPNSIFAPRLELPNLTGMPDFNALFDDVEEYVSYTEQSSTTDVNRNPYNMDRPFNRRSGSSFLSDRMSSLRPDRATVRHSLRRRRSPIRRGEDQAAMLSRLLSIAAAATAASLMGDDHRAVSEARSVGADGEDGTFDSFLQSLQSGRIAAALRQSTQEAEGTDRQGQPLNFFRMFRFGPQDNSNNGSRRDSRSRPHSRSDPTPTPASPARAENEEEGSERLVPIIIVGIRSINPGAGAEHDPEQENIPPFLDALSTFPSPISTPTGQDDAAVDNVLRQPQNGTSFSHRRRTSLGGSSTFPSNYDSQRHHRSPDRPRPASMLSESPLGPRPPPSTPASSGLSAVSSGTTTPTYMPSNGPSRRESFLRRTTSTGLEATAEDEPQYNFRPRHRDHEFTRFGSGSSRRNGVVEPDTATTSEGGTRSWIIYVLGGSYPENHPLLTTPSLFTDSPTYEDMILLSALLGPVKPPVATDADLAAAPGLFTIRAEGGQRTAVAVEGDETIAINPDENCLVCLCEYDAGEEARRLKNCGHLFHRECIDEWLTTGRNSCPLCRGKGVDDGGQANTRSDGTPISNPLAEEPPVIAP